MIDLCTLGTGGAIPLPERALSSLYIRVGGKALLIDCGEGTQTEIRRLGWGFRCIDGVLLTHYHADHCGGMPGFLLSMAKTGRTDPLHIYGPTGLHRVIEAFRVIAPQLTYPLTLHELPMADTSFSLIGLDITAFPLNHGMPCLGYRFALNRRPAFDPKKAQALNIPVCQWKLLQQGQAVKVDGLVIPPEAVLGAPRKGLSFLYATDTRPVDAIAHHGFRTDLMILEGMYGSEDKRPQALSNHHMMFSEAATLAREAEAGQLVLTHFSNCIEDPAAFLPNATAIFPATQVSHDGMCMTLRFPDRGL